jgi:hypothetical protein
MVFVSSGHDEYLDGIFIFYQSIILFDILKLVFLIKKTMLSTLSMLLSMKMLKKRFSVWQH